MDHYSPGQCCTSATQCEIPHNVKARFVTTITLDQELVDRIAAVETAGVPFNRSAAARAGIVAELERAEATVAKRSRKTRRDDAE